MSRASWSVPLAGSHALEMGLFKFSDVSQFTLLLFQNILEQGRLIIPHGVTSVWDDWGLRPRTSLRHPEGSYTVTVGPSPAISLPVVHEARREGEHILQAGNVNKPWKKYTVLKVEYKINTRPCSEKIDVLVEYSKTRRISAPIPVPALMEASLHLGLQRLNRQGKKPQSLLFMSVFWCHNTINIGSEGPSWSWGKRGAAPAFETLSWQKWHPLKELLLTTSPHRAEDVNSDPN